ncbi:uncharacterized protein [Typha angustifolia]|uniref:uncharacterized protein n=1 Tax=Typha angustifolia TaxID=59011 RepID=UPI003C2E0F9B
MKLFEHPFLLSFLRLVSQHHLPSSLLPTSIRSASIPLSSFSTTSPSPLASMESTKQSSPADIAGAGGEDLVVGFGRPEFRREAVVGTVQAYDRHVFLCYKSPETWPRNVEAAESEILPRTLAAAIKARKGDMRRKARLTICEGEDGTDSSDADVLIFPDMIKYRRLTHLDVDNFVEEVLVKDSKWLLGVAETLSGSYIFVCAHGSRDKRCGFCGPVLIEKFQEEINARGLQGQVSIGSCSHIGGHKYAGNVIIFSNINGEVTGHWYGYVAPDDVNDLLEQHIGKGKIVDRIWRGQMGLSEEDQKAAQILRFQINDSMEKTTATDTVENGDLGGVAGCCQGTNSSTCCQSVPLNGKPENNDTAKLETQEIKQKETSSVSKAGNSEGKSSTCKICRMPTWFERWEREDMYAAVAVVTAIASVAVAYSCYKQLR